MDVRTGNERRTGQGEVLCTWGVWGVLLAVMGATYARLDPAETDLDIAKHVAPRQQAGLLEHQPGDRRRLA